MHWATHGRLPAELDVAAGDFMDAHAARRQQFDAERAVLQLDTIDAIAETAAQDMLFHAQAAHLLAREIGGAQLQLGHEHTLANIGQQPRLSAHSVPSLCEMIRWPGDKIPLAGRCRVRS